MRIGIYPLMFMGTVYNKRRHETVRMDPVNKYVQELQQKTKKVNIKVCICSLSSHNILFFFVLLKRLTQFSYAVSLLTTTY